MNLWFSSGCIKRLPENWSNILASWRKCFESQINWFWHSASQNTFNSFDGKNSKHFFNSEYTQRYFTKYEYFLSTFVPKSKMDESMHIRLVVNCKIKFKKRNLYRCWEKVSPYVNRSSLTTFIFEFVKDKPILLSFLLSIWCFTKSMHISVNAFSSKILIFSNSSSFETLIRREISYENCFLPNPCKRCHWQKYWMFLFFCTMKPMIFLGPIKSDI
jgi:hypothetical protein